MENNIDFAGSWLEVGMTIAAIIAGAITVLIPIIRKKRWNRFISKKNLDYPENFQWSTHTILHETLTELRVKLDCARTQIVQFHNTGQFLDGISMKKFSVTHESLTTGTAGEHGKRDMLVSMFLDKLNLLRDDNAKLHIVESLSESYTKQYFQNSNIIAFSMLPIRKNKEIVGYTMSQWCSWNKVETIDEHEVSNEMERSRNLIEIQLQQQLNSNKNSRKI